MENIELFKVRFEHHTRRHPNISWDLFISMMNEHLWAIMDDMQESGGEPDVIEYLGSIYVIDMSKETPSGRRNICYDMSARVNRKKFPPLSSAIEDAHAKGLTLVDEAMYMFLNELEPLDLKTSSWLLTPETIRSKGGALTGDTRFGRTFIYHNGADSYYGSRAYRGYFEVK